MRYIDNSPIPGISGNHTSYWIESEHSSIVSSNIFPKEIVDVAVIGGGIAGLTTAYILSKKKLNIVVLEKDLIAMGVTGYTTAKVTSLHTLIYNDLMSISGEEKARLYGEAQEEAIRFIKEQVDNMQIDCDFTTAPAYTYTESPDSLEKIKKEAESARMLGLPAEFVTETELPFKISGAVKFNNQAHFHPRKYLLRIGKEITENGGKIYENTKVENIEGNEVITILTTKGTVKAKNVVIATNYPIFDNSYYFTRLFPYRSYVLAAYLNTNVPKGMYINIDKPLFSLRPQKTSNGELAIITGLEHKTGEEKDTVSCYLELEELAKSKLDIKSVEYYWSAQDPNTPDGVPYIGYFDTKSKNKYIATGFNGWGMTNGTVSGLLISDLIMGRESKWKDVFDPQRADQFKKTVKLVKEDLKTGVSLIKGKFSSTPKCTHMGCALSYNTAEKSWDCPCHGSRFSADGEVIQGPAIKDIKIDTIQ